MALVIAQQLLVKLARQSLRQKEVFSKEKVKRKLADIKYLAAQKNIPKLSLRKEILHLEEQLQGVFQLEELLLSMKKQEATRTAAYKRQITELRNKLAKYQDVQLHRKVEKLTHLMGSALAEEEIKKDVEKTEPIPLWQPAGNPEEHRTLPFSPLDGNLTASRALVIQQRLTALRHELEITKTLKNIPSERVKTLEAQIFLLKQKLQEFQEKHPELLAQQIMPLVVQEPEFITEEKKVKHIMLLSPTGNVSSSMGTAPPQKIVLPTKETQQLPALETITHTSPPPKIILK